MNNSLDEAMWQLVANGDSWLYTSNRGWGYQPWVSGCFIAGNGMPMHYHQMRNEDKLMLISDEWWEWVFDSVAEADELIFKCCNKEMK